MASGPGGNQLSKRPRYIDETKVFVSAAKTGTREHLNSTLPPTDVLAKTRFRYLTTDGSDTGPYLKANP